jgi:hypothetical protein
MIKEKRVDYYEVLSQHFPGVAEKNHDKSLRSEVLMVKTLMVVLRAVMLCGLVDGYQCFEGWLVTTSKIIQHHNPDDRHRMQ